MKITRSCIHPHSIRSQGCINGRWVVEAAADKWGIHPAGTLVCDRAPVGEDLSLTFTAPDGLQYYDTVLHSRWNPRG